MGTIDRSSFSPSSGAGRPDRPLQGETSLRSGAAKKGGLLAWLLVLGLLVGGAPDGLEAQLANSSATTLGLAENTTATARAFEAISVNPAGLGMPGSGFSLALVPIRVRTALHPITLTDIADYEGVVIPDATKEEWLGNVIDNGRETGAFGADVSGLALTIGNVGLQVSSVASGEMSLPPGVIEALLYGNAGRTGEPSDLSLENGSASAFAASTAGVSLAIPLELMGWQSSVGATVKYTVGHAVLVGRSVTGAIQSDPLSLEAEFPIVLTGENHQDDFDGGRGVGLDLGFMMQMDDIHLGATVQNVFNTFEWDESKLVYVPGTASIQQGGNELDFEETSYDQASPEARQFIHEMTFPTSVHLGAALDMSESWTISGDLRKRMGDDGMAVGPDFHLGGGVESRHLRVLHLRAGAAVITDGFQYGGGLSLVLGPVNLSGAVLARNSDTEEGLLAQVGLSFGNR